MNGTSVEVDGRTLRLTSLDKVLYPAAGTTKAEVVHYYSAISALILPQLHRRPVTRKRWPDGTSSTSFFEKNAPGHTPEWVPTVRLRHEGGGAFGVSTDPHDVDYVLVEETATLVWLAQLAALELHTPQWRIDGAGSACEPDRLVIDLDPGPPAGLAECVPVALEAKNVLQSLGYRAQPVLSGSTGLHVYGLGIDVHRDDDGTPTASDVGLAVATELARLCPDRVITTMTRAERAGRVFVDWSQNNMAKTTICPYSLRGREQPTVAAPVSWDEVSSGDLRQLTYEQVLERVDATGDLFDR